VRTPSALALALGSLLALAACTPSVNPPTGARATAGPMATGPAVSGPAATAAATATAPAPAGTEVRVLDFTIDPLELSVDAGTVALAVTNDGPTVHNLTVRDPDGEVLFGTRDLREGASESISDKLQAGEYVLFCSLPGHESLGMKGTLTVGLP
jgi:plastocyanin